MSDVFTCAVRLLARREHSAWELTTKLLKKSYSAEEIQGALQECQRLGLQSESRFVESVLRTRIAQGYGPLKIRRELQNLQVDENLINDTLQYEQDNWQACAKRVWEKKYKNHGDFSYMGLQKQKQFLLYRGFASDTITALFKDISAIQFN